MAEKAMEEGTTQQASGNGAAASAGPGKPTITKVEAVRRSIEKLDGEATNSKIQADVKKRFEIELTTNRVSTCRATWQRGRKPRPSGQRRSSPLRHRSSSQPGPWSGLNSRRRAASTAVELSDILAVKDLVGRVGAGHLKTLIEALEK